MDGSFTMAWVVTAENGVPRRIHSLGGSGVSSAQSRMQGVPVVVLKFCRLVSVRWAARPRPGTCVVWLVAPLLRTRRGMFAARAPATSTSLHAYLRTEIDQIIPGPWYVCAICLGCGCGWGMGVVAWHFEKHASDMWREMVGLSLLPCLAFWMDGSLFRLIVQVPKHEGNKQT